MNETEGFSIKNYSPHLSFGREHENSGFILICDDGRELEGTEVLWSVGKDCYDYLMVAREDDKEHDLDPKEYIDTWVKWIFETVDHGFVTMIDSGRVIETSGLTGEQLKEEMFKREPYFRLEEFLKYLDHFESDLLDDPLVYALGCLSELDEIAEIAQYTMEDSGDWVSSLCGWREKMNIKIKIKEELKKRSTSAAKTRHAETDSFKIDVLKAYDENLSSYRSVADAARKLIKIAPVTNRTIEKWIREHTKVQK
jgi:hypothetical protein